jgi:hypothetical protein
MFFIYYLTNKFKFDAYLSAPLAFWLDLMVNEQRETLQASTFPFTGALNNSQSPHPALSH